MKNRAFTLTLAAAFLAAGPASARADLVVNGGFEAGFMPDPTNANDVPLDWDYTASADAPSYLTLGGPGFSGLDLDITPEEGAYYLAFGSPGQSPDMISQTLATTAGAAYTFSFYVDTEVAEGPFDLTASWNGSTVLDLSTPTAPPGWTQYTFTETGTGSDAFSFAGLGGYTDVLLDGVAVTPVASAAADTPLSLLPLALAAAALLSTKRRLSTSA